MIDKLEWLFGPTNEGGVSARMYLGTVDPPCVPQGSELRIPDANIADALRTMAIRRAEAPAIEEPVRLSSKRELQYDTMSFRHLDEEVDRLCHGLTRIGFERGMRVVVMIPPCRDFFSVTFALFRLGAVPVFVDPGIGTKWLKKCLDEAKPEGFIGIPKAHLGRVLYGWARRSIRLRVIVGGKGPWRGPTLKQVRQGSEPLVPFDGPVTRAEDPAAILFTSGSTGAPKGAVYHHAIFPAQVRHLQKLYALQEGEIDLPTFPLFGLFDIALGMTAVIPEMDFTRPASADPKKLLDTIDHFSVTNLFASPALLKNLARYAEKTDRRLPTLRRVLSAGAPVPADEIARLASRLAEGVQVHTPYGATEALPVATIGSDEIAAETAAKTRSGAGVCVGRPAPEIEVAVIPVHDETITTWDRSTCLPTDTVGELCVRGTVVSRQYFRRPTATAAAKIGRDSDLWHRMGDLARIDEQGRIWFQGRKAHRVWTSEGPLDSMATESIFNAHPKVARTALVGLGAPPAQQPLLCVELAEDVTVEPSELFSQLRTLGQVDDRTKQIDRFLIHPNFPVDIRHNAKIFREKLAAWAAENEGRSR